LEEDEEYDGYAQDYLDDADGWEPLLQLQDFSSLSMKFSFFLSCRRRQVKV
jgi:hypothetical protein